MCRKDRAALHAKNCNVLTMQMAELVSSMAAEPRGQSCQYVTGRQLSIRDAVVATHLEGFGEVLQGGGDVVQEAVEALHLLSQHHP